jgi:hypothetical protein
VILLISVGFTGVCRFQNLDKLIHYTNLDGRINIFYSTPAIYVAAKNAYNTTWPLKEDDFFPYADCPTCYWTGKIPVSGGRDHYLGHNLGLGAPRVSAGCLSIYVTAKHA